MLESLAMTQVRVSKRFEFLDGLRGIAACAVILFHFNGTLKEHGIFVIPTIIDFLCEWGRYGVQIFFVLSGFVIAYSLRNEKISSRFCLRFFLKRSLRLDPPYWLTIALMVILNLLGNLLFGKGKELLTTPYEFAINMLYLPDFLQVPRILPVAWTLCIEIQFYMSFIFLLWCYQSLMERYYLDQKSAFHQSFIFHLLFSSLMILSLMQNGPLALIPIIPGLFLPYWYSFFMGCLVCWTMLHAIHSLLLWIYFPILGYYAYVQGNSEIAIVGCVAFTLYMAVRMERMHCWLTSWFMQYSGKISYSLYLIHWPIGMKCMDVTLRFFGDRINHLGGISLLLFMSVALTFLAAHCFYYLIEYPSLKLSRYLKKVDRDEYCR